MKRKTPPAHIFIMGSSASGNDRPLETSSNGEPPAESRVLCRQNDIPADSVKIAEKYEGCPRRIWTHRSPPQLPRSATFPPNNERSAARSGVRSRILSVRPDPSAPAAAVHTGCLLHHILLSGHSASGAKSTLYADLKRIRHPFLPWT